MSVFPEVPLTFRAVYKGDGSAKATFLAEVLSMTDQATRQFKDFSAEAQRQLDAALSVKRNPTGSLDLGVDELRASAAAMQARATAAREVAQATALAAQEEGDYSQKARLAVAATQALAIEEERAAAKAMAHAQAAEQVQERLNRQASATDMVVAATKRGTSESANVINGIRAQRVAFTQLGQQMQDVVVQTQMGTNATTIFVQQVPQMAFALSGLSESTNKTYANIGKFGSFLAGPWGTAVFIGAAVLGPLVASLLDSGDAADKSSSAHRDLIDVLSDSKASYEEVTKAARDYADAQSKANQTTLQTIQLEAQSISVRLQNAIAIRKEISALIDRYNADAASGPTGLNGQGQLGAAIGSSVLQGQQAQNNAMIEQLSRSAQQVTIKAATAIANVNSDPVVKIRTGFDELRSRAKDTIKDFDDLTARITDLNRREQAAIDANRAANRKTKSKTGKSDEERAAERAAREAEKLARFGDKAAESIQRINERFNEQPRLVDQASQATRELDSIIADLEKRQPPGFAGMIADAEKAKEVIQDALVRPFQQLERDSERRLTIQNLLSSGREAEAAAAADIWRLEEQLGPLTADRKADVIAIAQAEQDQIEALQRAHDIQAAYLDATRSVRQEVEAILGGYGKLSNLKGIFQQLRGKILAEKLFGDVFRDLDKWVKDKTGIGSSVDMMAKETERAGGAAGKLADALNGAADRIANTGIASGDTASSGMLDAFDSAFGKQLPAAANDNRASQVLSDGTIVVEASKPQVTPNTVGGMSAERYASILSEKLTKPLLDGFDRILGTSLSKKLSGPLAGAMEGYLTTGTGFGAVLGGLKDLKGLPDGLKGALGKAFGGAQTGATVAGIGNMLGLGMSNTGAQIGGAIGSLIPIPGGDIIGSIAGGLIGKLFAKWKKGSAVITQDGITIGGNDDGRKQALSGMGDSLQGSLQKVADQLGASIGQYAVSIGFGKENYRVSASGSSRVGDKSYPKGAGSDLLYDGPDAEAALRAAISNAIQDGAIAGVKASTQRLLKAGKDLETQLQKALDFEGVFKQLKAYKDPVGAALDDLDLEFKRLSAIFKEAGATTEEYAQLEELYGLKRAEAVKKAAEQMTASLQSLYDEITIGNDARSLRDRKADALAKYKPLEDRVKAGDKTAYDDYAAAARDLLAIERQMSGSQTDYFALLDQVEALTKSTIDDAKSLADASASRDSPFSGSGAGAANDNSGVTTAIGQLSDLLGLKLDAVNENLGALIQQAIASGKIASVFPLKSAGNW